jgi:hypothetical protein
MAARRRLIVEEADWPVRDWSGIQLWKTKRFQLFNHHVIEELSLMAKFSFAKSIAKMPKGVAADIDRLNALRNGLAHAFFPENSKRSKPELEGQKHIQPGGAEGVSGGHG